MKLECNNTLECYNDPNCQCPNQLGQGNGIGLGTGTVLGLMLLAFLFLNQKAR